MSFLRQSSTRVVGDSPGESTTKNDFSNSGRTSSEIDLSDDHDVKIVWVVVEWVVVLQLGSGTGPVAPHPR